MKKFLFTTLIFTIMISCSNDTTSPDDKIDTTSTTAQVFLGQVKGRTASIIVLGSGWKYSFDANGTTCTYSLYTSDSVVMSSKYSFKEAINNNESIYTISAGGQSEEVTFRVDGNTLYYGYQGTSVKAGELN